MSRFLRLSIGMHVALLALVYPSTPLRLSLLGAYLVYHGWVARGILHPRSRLFGPNLSRMATSERVVALTFDDGPHPEVTPRVLDLLRRRGVKATFFLIGKWVDEYPEVARAIVADGHAVGNHSFSHSYLFWALPRRKILRELAQSQKAIESAAGVKPCWFRAPVGLKNCLLWGVLSRLGLTLVSWDVRFLGRRGLQGQRLAERLASSVRPGSILLLHDGHDRRREGNPALLETLPALLDALVAMDYRCVPLTAGRASW